MLVVSAPTMLFFNSTLRWLWSNSSQMKPRHCKEDILINTWSWFALVHKLPIKSVHSPRGISIAAIAEIKLALYLRTKDDWQASVPRTACFIFCLKNGSNWIQMSAKRASERLAIKFLQMTAAIWRAGSELFSSATSLTREAKNFLYNLKNTND